VALPSIARAGERLRPLLSRVGLSLPEFDPSQLFLELRVRLGLDLFDPTTLEAAGIDPTGPLYLVDEGTLTHPVLMVRLLPDGATRFERAVVERVAQREQLTATLERKQRGLVVRGRAAAPKAQARFAYALDGARLAFAPMACSEGIACVARSLRPRRKLLKDATTRGLLAGLPDAAVYLLARDRALGISPSRTGRRAAAEVSALALALDGDAGMARLTIQALPTRSGRQRATGWPTMSGRAATELRQIGALSLYLGIDVRRSNRALQALPYHAALQRVLEGSGLSLQRELTALANGGVGLHLLDLEPKLPGLVDRRDVSDADTAFFAEQGLVVPYSERCGSSARVAWSCTTTPRTGA